MNYSSNKHLLRYADLEYARTAFVDARTPGSHLKENYCLIGPGVSQNPRQPIHILETNGFNVGAAGQPPGILNSLHSHFSAEIFIVFKGQFRIYWGPDGENEAVIGPGDIISVPIHCFRGFEVVGEDYGFIFVVLGGDKSGGGIEWHPEVMLEGRENGLYLKKDGTLVDTVAGDPLPDADDLFPLLDMDTVQGYDNYTVEEMLKFVSFRKDWKSITNNFTSAGDFNLYAVSGHAEHKDNFAIKSKDYVSIYAYEISKGAEVPMHLRKENQVLINYSGDVLIHFENGELMPILLGPGDVYDMPLGTAFSLEGVRGESCIYCVVKGDKVQDPQLK